MVTSGQLVAEYRSAADMLGRLHEEGVAQVSKPDSSALDSVEIGSLLDPRLRLRESLILRVSQEGNVYIATCEELNESSIGVDPINAVQTLRNDIATRYWQLKDGHERLIQSVAESWRQWSMIVFES